MLKENNRYEILTPDGFKNFDGMRKLQKDTIEFSFNNNTPCRVSKNHTFRINGSDIIANTLKIGDYIGTSHISNIKEYGIRDVYDPINVDGSVYYGNNLLHHNCDFIGSESTVLDESTLKSLVARPIEDPIEVAGNGAFRIYEKPIMGAQYIMGVDVAKGTGEHSSTIQVYKVITVKPIQIDNVATFESDTTDVYKFSSIVNNTSIYYNNAYIVCENNAEGSTIVNQLWWEYENENLVCEGTTSTKLGVRATTKTKPVAVLLMKKLIEDESVTIRDHRTIQQLLTFIDHGTGKFSGNGQDDDLVSALYWTVYFFTFDLLDEKFEFKDSEEETDEWGIFGDNDFEEEEGYELVRR